MPGSRRRSTIRADRRRAIAVMTDPALPSGTDRVAAVAAGARLERRHRGRQRPGRRTVPAAGPDRAGGGSCSIDDPAAGIATLAAPIANLEEFLDPNVVKVVHCARCGRRSISAVRRFRGPATERREAWAASATLPVRCATSVSTPIASVRCVVSLRCAPSALETCEKLEQLRALESGVRIAVGRCVERPEPGVDTEADLQRARRKAAAVA